MSSGNQTHVCLICNKDLKKKKILVEHKVKVHPKKASKSSWKCLKCEIVFSDRKKRLAHMNKMHPQCYTCDLYFLSKFELAKHKELHYIPSVSVLSQSSSSCDEGQADQHRKERDQAEPQFSDQLGSSVSDEILVRNSPKDLPMLKSKVEGVNLGSSGDRRPGEQQVVKYCQYPPDGVGNVSIYNEDYNCLEAEQFLNDVIIDFYLKYLQTGVFKNINEVMDRTHIFTTYFYKRLTTRTSNNSKVQAHPIEDNPNLSAAEKRYERVKKWTKKVNLFEKDFIVVPINEESHWFVCVICFPGQSGCVRTDDLTPCVTPPGQARNRNTMKKNNSNSKKPLTKGSTTIIPLNGRGQGEDNIRYTLDEDMSDRDEAEASDEDMDDENGSKKMEEGAGAKTAIRQPCILTFDSLSGGSKASTHQTLREYLSFEWKNKMVPSGAEEKVFTKDTMVGDCPKVQLQPNSFDCGIFLLQYVESFFRDPIGDYSLPISSMKEWFPKKEVQDKRDYIASLIRKLAWEQNPGEEFNFPELNFFTADSVSVSGLGPGHVVPDEGVPHCFSCKKDVQTTSLGKYCVKFGSDIKQFCSIVCLDDYMKGLKVCSYCQKDISGEEGFLAPIGENGQFKDFCEQSCLHNYELIHLGAGEADDAGPTIEEIG